MSDLDVLGKVLCGLAQEPAGAMQSVNRVLQPVTYQYDLMMGLRPDFSAANHQFCVSKHKTLFRTSCRLGP